MRLLGALDASDFILALARLKLVPPLFKDTHTITKFTRIAI
ncbi:MAG: hypothetical protein QXD14_04395 [Sulfolobales archaeon]